MAKTKVPNKLYLTVMNAGSDDNCIEISRSRTWESDHKFIRVPAHVSNQTNLDFLKEIQERISDQADPTRVEYARQMVSDWIAEIERTLKEE